MTDLKGNQVSLATTVSDETAKIKKEIASPSALHYKGITITPGGFLAAETVYRTKATGGDIPTAFSAIPYEGADAYSLSEFYGSARQSRVTLLAEGKTSWGTLRGYYEADWLGTGITSNNNQSNSYVLRQRVLWAQAETNSHWAFAGGQLWSLATEDKKGISNLSGDILTPLTIDPNYVPGFVWTRQYGFRVTKTFNKAAFGVAVENPQLLYTASLAGNTPYAVLGSAGQNGGNYNAAVSASVPTTYIQNYSNQVTATGSIYVPSYNTIYANTNIANYSFNQAPDVMAKVAFDPGWGHYEIFGIAGFAHETVYPGVTTNSTKYGGQYDIECPKSVTGCTPVAASSSTSGYYNNSITLGGIGGSLRVPVVGQQADVRRQGPLRTRHGPLRRLDAGRRDGRRQRQSGSHPQPLRPAYRRSQPHSPPGHLPQLRRRLRRPHGLRHRQHLCLHSRLALRNLLPDGTRHDSPAPAPHCGRTARGWRHLGRPLEHTRRWNHRGRLRLALAEQLKLQHHRQPRLQRQLHRLLPRRLLRRANPRRAGNHRRLLV